MAVNKPDIYQHNNPNLAFVDSDFVKGGFRTSVANLAALYALSGKTGTQYAAGQLKDRSTVVYVTSESKYYILKDINNANNVNGWEIFVTGGGNGTLTGVTNGLSLVKGGTTVSLGGALTGNTSLSGNYTLNINGGAKLNSTCGYQISGVTVFDTTRNSLTNIRIGQNTLINNTTGLCNIAIGSNALSANTIGRCNVGIGVNILTKNVSGNWNVSIGSNSLSNNISGCANIGIGYGVFNNNISGSGNFGIGSNSLASLINGCGNIAIGQAALGKTTSGCSSIAIGRWTGCGNILGLNNIYVGNCAGRNSTGSTNIFIGNCAGYNETGSGKLYIGSGNTALIMGDMIQDCVILPKLKLRTAPTGSGGYLCYDPSTCLVGQTSGGTGGGGSQSSDTQILFNKGGVLSGNTNLIYCYDNDTVLLTLNSQGTGLHSVAMNGGTVTGNNSVAMTNGTAIGDFSVAMSDSYTYGLCSVAMAGGTACGVYSVAMVCGTAYSGSSVAMVGGNTCQECSIAMNGGVTCGYGSIAMIYGTTCGSYSIAMNGGVTCGSSSFAIRGEAVGNCSTVIGGTAYGDASFAISDGIAYKYRSVAMIGGYADGIDSFVVGGCNNSYSDNGSILGGQFNTLNSGNTDSVLLGGNSMTIPADTYISTVIVPNLAIICAPETGSSSDSILVWNSTDKKVKTVSGSMSGDLNNIYSTTIITGNTTLTTGSTYAILVNSPTSIISVTLPLTPKNGEVFKIKDVSGKALTYNITINGNGRNIDGSSTALINTDYGAVELLYNSSLNAWFALSFMY